MSLNFIMNEHTPFENFRFSNMIDDDSEFIPLLSSEDEEQMNTEEIPNEVSILPLRNTVLFPGVVIPITVGRDKSIKLIKDAYKSISTYDITGKIISER